MLQYARLSSRGEIGLFGGFIRSGSQRADGTASAACLCRNQLRPEDRHRKHLCCARHKVARRHTTGKPLPRKADPSTSCPSPLLPGKTRETGLEDNRQAGNHHLL